MTIALNALDLANVKQRIFNRCEWRDGPLDTRCLVWTGYRNCRVGGEYGRITYNGKSRFVHRLTWMAEKGEIGEGLFVCHKCDCPPCCNVDHLFVGTNSDNLRDCVNKGRHDDRHGENNSRALLTEAEVSLIKYFLQQGWSSARLAKRYGVSRSAIFNIKTKRTWRHVNDDAR